MMSPTSRSGNAALRLGVSERRVRQLAGEGRVRGATKAGRRVADSHAGGVGPGPARAGLSEG